MKLFTIIITLIITTVHSFAQTPQEIRIRKPSIYARALSDFASFRTAKGISSTLYFDGDYSVIADFNEDELLTRNIVLLTPAKKKKIYSRNGNRLTNTTIFPARISDDKVTITFTPYALYRAIANRLCLETSSIAY